MPVKLGRPTKELYQRTPGGIYYLRWNGKRLSTGTNNEHLAHVRAFEMQKARGQVRAWDAIEGTKAVGRSWQLVFEGAENGVKVHGDVPGNNARTLEKVLTKSEGLGKIVETGEHPEMIPAGEGVPGPAPVVVKKTELSRLLETELSIIQTKAPKMAGYYKQHYEYLDRFFIERGLSHPAEMTVALVREWCGWRGKVLSQKLLKGKEFCKRPAKANTIRKAFGLYRAQWDSWQGEGIVQINPFKAKNALRALPHGLDNPGEPFKDQAEVALVTKELERAHYNKDGELDGRRRESGKRDADFVRLFIRTGCRSVEIFNLKNSQVSGCELTIWNAKKQRDDKTKLDAAGLVLLNSMRDTTGEYCFPDYACRPYEQHEFSKRLSRACHDLKIGHHTVHDLRHTYGTWAVRAGVPIIELKELMHHESIVTTEKYIKMAGLAQSKNAEKMGALMTGF